MSVESDVPYTAIRILLNICISTCCPRRVEQYKYVAFRLISYFFIMMAVCDHGILYHQPLTACARVPVRAKLSCGEVFQLSCDASVILPSHANSDIRTCGVLKSWKSQYDSEGVGATANQINK